MVSHHVVRLLGVVGDFAPVYVVMELMQEGDLKSYLDRHKNISDQVCSVQGIIIVCLLLSKTNHYYLPSCLTGFLGSILSLSILFNHLVADNTPLQRVIEMAAEAGDGMSYLEYRRVVHRDLAARNCLLDHHLTLKICDFGLSRNLVSDYYRKSQYINRGMFPLPILGSNS